MSIVTVFIDDQPVASPKHTIGYKLLILAGRDNNRWLFRTPDNPLSCDVVQIGELENIQLKDGDKFHTTPPCHW